MPNPLKQLLSPTNKIAVKDIYSFFNSDAPPGIDSLQFDLGHQPNTTMESHYGSPYVFADTLAIQNMGKNALMGTLRHELAHILEYHSDTSPQTILQQYLPQDSIKALFKFPKDFVNYAVNPNEVYARTATAVDELRRRGYKVNENNFFDLVKKVKSDATNFYHKLEAFRAKGGSGLKKYYQSALKYYLGLK